MKTMGRKIDFLGKLYTYIAYRSIDCIFLVISLSFVSNFPHIAEDSLHFNPLVPKRPRVDVFRLSP